MTRGRGSRLWQAVGAGLVAIVVTLAVGFVPAAPARAAPSFVAAGTASAGAPTQRDKPCPNAVRANLIRCFGQACTALPGTSGAPLAPRPHAGRRIALDHHEGAAACGDSRLERPPRQVS